SGGGGGGESYRSSSPAPRVTAARPPATHAAPVAMPVAPPSAPIPMPVAPPSAPVAMPSVQPSSPVPAPPADDKVASGSGPHAPRLALPNNPAEALAAWSKVIDYLEEQRKISLRGYYEFARVLKWTKDELELGFAPEAESKWAGENAVEKQNVDELRVVLGELGQKVKLTARMLDVAEAAKSPARSLVESTRATSTADRARREA